MRTVGLKVLKNRLSEYVRLASGGETILISDRDKVVAELTPPQPTRSISLPDAMLAEAVRNGLITPALRPPGPPPKADPVCSLDDLLEELAADRADR
ncbi:MAG: type II toxin-antitoxin system Phd/YefM family antitoxin [Actinomycetota bacterium]